MRLGNTQNFKPIVLGDKMRLRVGWLVQPSPTPGTKITRDMSSQ